MKLQDDTSKEYPIQDVFMCSLNSISLQHKSGLILRSFKKGSTIYDTPESPGLFPSAVTLPFSTQQPTLLKRENRPKNIW